MDVERMDEKPTASRGRLVRFTNNPLALDFGLFKGRWSNSMDDDGDPES